MNLGVRLAAAALLVGVAPVAGAQGSAQAAPGDRPPARARGPIVEQAPLERPVTLRLDDVPLIEAIQAIDRQADLRLAYTERILPAGRRVTISLRDVPAREALAAVLEGTGLVVRQSARGHLSLGRAPRAGGRTEAGPDTLPGAVAGRVVDSASRQPLAGVAVRIGDGALTVSTVTNDSGIYMLASVPAGAHVLRARHIGYRPVERTVVVPENALVREDLELTMSPSRLQEVVSTATGDRRRLELGNDIVVIDADSIVRTQPVTSVTDLLVGRVPGLVVQQTSGAPGDPARLRFRGVSSPQLSNDPIVVVDGIRVYAAQSDERSENLAGAGTSQVQRSYATPSPLDNIDPNSIERIEVFKGPSAATLYGQDAARGVIVITTKRGRPGPARWSASAERGWSALPEAFPDLYLRWGHRLADGERVMCPLTNLDETGSACQADSVVRFQLLNEPSLSVLAPGARTGARIGVSGGSASLTYAVNASYQEEGGSVRLPAYEIERYRLAHDASPPGWMQRPQRFTQWGATSQVTAQLGSSAEVALLAALTRTEQQRSALEQQLGELMVTYLDRGTGTYYRGGLGLGSFSPVEDLLTEYYERATAAATKFTNGVNLTWRTRPWLTTQATAGLDVVQRADQVFLPHGLTTDPDSVGRLGLGQGTSVVSTAKLQANARAPLPLGFRLDFAMGVDYQRQSIADLSGHVTGLADGTSSPNPGGQVREIDDLRERRIDQATFGWFLAPTLAHKRFWLNTGLRLDGGSTFGTRLQLPTFPKLSVSYLISDESFFPLKSFVNTLVLRAAYGHAGQQPGPTDRLRLFTARGPVWIGDRFVDGVQLQTLGNTELRPERSRELEGGFDADLFDDRLRLAFTGYRTTTTDALMRVPLPPSVYGDGVQVLRNIGVIRNEGLELSVGTAILRGDAVTLNADLSLSRNRNVVLELGQGVTPFYIGHDQRVAPGYPLFGRWARPVLGYADADDDGVIDSDEVVVGDTAVYVGEAAPNYTANLSTSLSLMRGMFVVTTRLSYDDGLTQQNEVMRRMGVFARGRHDPDASLHEQAIIAALDRTQYGLIQTVSVLRFTDASLTYNVPRSTAQRLGARALSISLQGTNLGLRTNYRGLDPNVNGSVTGNSVVDTGVLPQPRAWQVRVNASY